MSLRKDFIFEYTLGMQLHYAAFVKKFTWKESVILPVSDDTPDERFEKTNLELQATLLYLLRDGNVWTTSSIFKRFPLINQQKIAETLSMMTYDPTDINIFQSLKIATDEKTSRSGWVRIGKLKKTYLDPKLDSKIEKELLKRIKRGQVQEDTVQDVACRLVIDPEIITDIVYSLYNRGVILCEPTFILSLV